MEDVSHLSDEELKMRSYRASVQLVLRALRDARSHADLARWLLDSVGLIRAVLAADRGAQVLLLLIRYLYRVGPVDDPDAFLEAIRITMGDEMKENAMTMEQRALARGEERGLQQGLQQHRKTVLRLLQTRFGSLAPATVERIERANAGDLERWAVGVFAATSVEDLLAD